MLGNLTPQQWDELEALFDGLMESARPEDYIAGVADPILRPALQQLWMEHSEANQAGFLDQAVVDLHTLADPDFAFTSGQVLDNRFTIEKLLGYGGMGEVYLAFDRRLDVQVALKTISGELAQRPEIRQRFVAEVQNARQVTHPNVCRIYDLSDQGELPFYTMQYLEGPTLAEWLEGPEKPLALRRKIAIDIAEGLAAAHRSGILHRDLKPANVIVAGAADRPSAVITDFGLARAFQQEDTGQSNSLQAGTWDYMAPELKAGAPATVASDIYAFGRILGRLVPGERLAAACTAARPEQRPRSLEPAIERWRSAPTRRRWISMVVAASPLAAYGGYKIFAPPRVIFGSRQRLLLNAFVPNADTVASEVRDLLLTALRQSPLVNLVADERFRPLFATRGKEPASAAAAPLLSAARQAHVPFLLDGVLQHAGKSLKLILSVIDTANGQPILSVLQAGTADAVVRLADQASQSLRRSIGESEESLRATYKNLALVTSAIPEAIDAYFRGVRLYESADALQSRVWFERAIELDPQFALAHLYRGISLAAADNTELGFPSYCKAYELRFRVAERERLWIESRYANVTEDHTAGVDILRKLVNLYPDEAVLQRHMGLAYAKSMRPADALAYDRKAIELDPASVNNRNVLLNDLVQAGQFDQALEQVEQFRAEGVASPMLELGAAMAWMGKGEYDKAGACFDRMAAGAERDREVRTVRPGLLILQGRFRQAEEELDQGLSYTTAVGQSYARETYRLRLGLTNWLMDQPDAARLRALEISRLPLLPLFLPFLHEAGLLAYLAGAPEIVSAILGRLREIESKWRSTHSQGARAHLEGLEKQAQRNPDAHSSLVEARGVWPNALVLFSLARWQFEAGRMDEALAVHEELDQQKGAILRWHFNGLIVLGWLERARCLRAVSRTDESLRYYRRVLDHWGRSASSSAVVRSARTEFLELSHSKG
jgi:serine/threonine protein kinase/Tfp pilus assembly protein PilF